ncbi:MAG: DUF2339 domain-containing protein, partial [Psychrobacter sp.]|nr:DUF2339 domain-containing protein [Psychrobacter sp.]
MMFEFIALLVVIVFLFNKLNNKIVDLNNDIADLQDELRQHKNDLKRLKSSDHMTENTSLFSSSSEVVAPSPITPPPLPTLVSANPNRNNHDPVHKFVQPNVAAKPVQASDYSTNPVADVTEGSVNTNISTSTQSNLAIEPDEHSLPIVTSLFNSLKNWFLGGNLVVRVGVLVLLVGVVLLLRLVSDYVEISIESKLIAIGVTGLALAGLGLKLATKRFAYGITLQGAGLAIAYLTTFFAYDVYKVLASVPSFIALGLISVLTIGLAVRQNAFPLALLALGGGFFAPLLTATDTGSLTALFSYYLLLNIAVAIIAHYRTWKVLNILGVAVTFGLAYYFGGFATLSSEIDEQRWSLMLLVALHLALYLFIAIRYTQQIIAYNVNYEASNSTTATTAATASDAKPVHSLYLYPMDIGLLFSVPVLAFGLFAALLHDIEHALTLTSAILGVVYLTLGWSLIRRSQRYALITEGMLALGFGFLALVIPLAFDAEWIAVGWSIQGVALVWFGRRSLRAWLVIFGLLLQIGSVALLTLYTFFDDATTLAMSLSAIASLGAVFILRASNSPSVLLATTLQTSANISHTTYTINSNNPDNINNEVTKYASALGISPQAARQWLMSINRQTTAFNVVWRSPAFIIFLTFIAIVWSLYVLINDFDLWFEPWQLATTTLIALATLFSLSIYWLINHYRAWAEIRYFSHALLSLFYLALVLQLPQKFEFDHQWTTINWAVFAILLLGWLVIAQLWLKTWYDKVDVVQDISKKSHTHLALYHFASWLGTGILVLAAAVYYGLSSYYNMDGVMAVLIPSLLLITLISYAERKFARLLPWFDWKQALIGCSFIFIPLSLIWVVTTNFYQDGIVWNMPYIPIINLYDITIIMVMAYGLSMYHLYTTAQTNPAVTQTPNTAALPLTDWANMVAYAIGIIGFWVLSSILVRTLHAYAGT